MAKTDYWKNAHVSFMAVESSALPLLSIQMTSHSWILERPECVLEQTVHHCSPCRKRNKATVLFFPDFFVMFCFWLLQPVWVSLPQQVKTWAALQLLRKIVSKRTGLLKHHGWPSGGGAGEEFCLLGLRANEPQDTQKRQLRWISCVMSVFLDAKQPNARRKL